MYIGGVDKRAMHHLVVEILDNCMDEVIANYADKIEVCLLANNKIKITDNGRGIPIDKHPKFPEKTALEVILTTLHAGGKFSEKNYKISGGLHGVGASVVNALSLEFVVEVIRNKKFYKQKYEKGLSQGKLEFISETNKISGTSITFSPDPEIFGEDTSFYHLISSQLFKIKHISPGVKIHWK